MSRACGECPPDPGAAVGAVASAVAGAVCAVGRTAVRVAVHRLEDEQLEHGRRVLCWAVPWVWLVACAGTWWLGRPAAGIWGGIAVGSWVLGQALGAEVGHREERANLARMRARQARARVRKAPVVVEPQPVEETQTLDDELAAVVAADKASRGGH